MSISVDLDFLDDCFEKFDFDASQLTFASVGSALQLPSCGAQCNLHYWPIAKTYDRNCQAENGTARCLDENLQSVLLDDR